MAKTLELKGGLVVALLLLLTGIVGTLFIVLGPQATEKSPGVIHIGVRYANERSLEFNQYGKSGPGATIEIVAPDGKIAYTHENLQIGRNLMPLKDIPNGHYMARLSAHWLRNPRGADHSRRTHDQSAHGRQTRRRQHSRL